MLVDLPRTLELIYNSVGTKHLMPPAFPEVWERENSRQRRSRANGVVCQEVGPHHRGFCAPNTYSSQGPLSRSGKESQRIAFVEQTEKSGTQLEAQVRFGLRWLWDFERPASQPSLAIPCQCGGHFLATQHSFLLFGGNNLSVGDLPLYCMRLSPRYLPFILLTGGHLSQASLSKLVFGIFSFFPKRNTER